MVAGGEPEVADAGQQVGFHACDAAAVRSALTALKARPGGWVLTDIVVALLEGMLLLLADDLEAAGAVLDRVGGNADFFTERWLAILRAEIDLSLGDVAGGRRRVTEIEDRLDGTELPFYRAGVDLLTAHIARARGEPGEAETRAHQGWRCPRRRL